MWKRRRGHWEQAGLAATAKTQQQFIELTRGREVQAEAEDEAPWNQMIPVTLFECNGRPNVVTHSKFQKCLEQTRVLIWSVFLYERHLKKNLLDTLGGLCKNVLNDALSAVMYVDGYSFWNVAMFLCRATSNSCYTRVFHAFFNDGNASRHQPNGNARSVFNVTKWCPTTLDYNMTYTWFWKLTAAQIPMFSSPVCLCWNCFASVRKGSRSFLKDCFT